MDHGTLDRLLRQAITERWQITFMLNGCRRIGEPHDYGIHAGVPRLFFYQTAGESSSGSALGWRWATLSKVSDLKVLEQTFPGPRAVPTNKHLAWEQLFASVSSRVKAKD